jgi:hypothetical protein
MQLSMEIANTLGLSVTVYGGWLWSEMLYKAFSADIQNSVFGLDCQK